MVAQVRVVTGATAPRLGPDGQQLRAAGAVRVSEGKQGLGYSPQTQRQAILARAHGAGYLMDDEDIYEDHERGHKLTRKGYVAILAGVRAGRYSAVFVFMLDRWGRDSIERQQRGREFDRLGVPLVSVVEGVDEPGLIRVIRAELAEEESRKNAARVTPNRERAAREGTHMGSTPYGYKRVYAQWDGTGRRPAGILVPHEPEARIVQELFARYASGAWSTAELAADLNARGITPPHPGRHKGAPAWKNGAVHDILSNVCYTGVVSYNVRPTGHYQRAETGSAFVADGKHAPLVSPELFTQVQQRLAQARTYVSVARRTHVHLLAGLLRCQACGGLMVPMLPPTSGPGTAFANHGALRCSNRHHGGGCAGRGYRLDLAERALLREVGRLHGSPWSAAGAQALAGPDAGARARLAGELADLRARQDDATERLLDRALGGPERASLQRVSAKLSTRIAELEEQQAQLGRDAAALPRLRALHTKLRALSPAQAAAQLHAQGDVVGLRDLVTLLVDHAVLAERRPERRSTWLRFSVTWSADVEQLLAAGLLTLAPPEEAPAR